MNDSEDIRSIIESISLRNDEIAFRRFFNLYYPKLFRFAFSLIKSDELAKEIVSDVFIKIWNNRSQLMEIEKIDYYMFRAIRNQSLTYLGRQDFNLDNLDKLPESRVVSYQNPENAMMSQEMIDKIEFSISNLPPKCQTIFRLSREDGFKFKEISALLKISESTVKNQVTNALTKLKSDLKAYFDGNL